MKKINENKENFNKIRISRLFLEINRFFQERLQWAFENMQKITILRGLKEEFRENYEMKYEFFREFLRKRIESSKKTPMILKKKAFFLMKQRVLEDMLKRNILFFYMKNMTFNHKLGLKKRFELYRLKGYIN